MQYSRFVVLLWGLDTVSTLLILATVFMGIGFVIFFIMFLVKRFGDLGRDTEEVPVVRKVAKTLGIIFASLLIVCSVVPSQKTILAYVALKAVDQYNARNPTSNLQSDNIIKTADDLIGVIDEAIQKAEKALNGK